MNMTPTLEKPETSEQDGSFYAYPSHKIVSVFAQTEDLRDALDAHRENGVKESEIEVISSTEQIDFSGEENGSWARIVRTVQQLGSEGRYLDRYKQELKDGHFLLTVVAKNAETKKKVKEMLQSNGGLRLTFFGNWLIEEIPEAPKIEFDTHPYGYRREV